MEAEDWVYDSSFSQHLAFYVVLFRLKMICCQIFYLPINLILTTQKSTKKTILYSGRKEDWTLRKSVLSLSIIYSSIFTVNTTAKKMFLHNTWHWGCQTRSSEVVTAVRYICQLFWHWDFLHTLISCLHWLKLRAKIKLCRSSLTLLLLHWFQRVINQFDSFKRWLCRVMKDFHI